MGHLKGFWRAERASYCTAVGGSTEVNTQEMVPEWSTHAAGLSCMQKHHVADRSQELLWKGCLRDTCGTSTQL